MSVFNGPMVGFDTETTGVDVYNDRIVTISLVYSGGPGEVEQVTEWLINPGIEIPKEASDIHGVTTERAVAEGMAPAQALKEALVQLNYYMQAGIPTVAYNANYDFTILREDLNRNGCEPIVGDFAPVIDPLVLDKFLDQYRKGSRTLAAVAKHYGVKLDKAHESTWDAKAAIGIARAMASGVGSNNVTDPMWLHTAQMGYQKTQQESLNQHWKRTNKSDRIRPAGWPFLPSKEA